MKSCFGDDGDEQLRPEDEVYVLDVSRLEVGDVILTSSPGHFESAAIRLATWGNFSHAVLVLNSPTIIESGNAGVIRSQVDRMCVRSPENIQVRRVVDTHCFDRRVLVKTAESLMGVAYADIDAVSSILRFVPSIDRGRVFCSQLVAYCFEQAGLEIVPRKKVFKVVPADLAKSPVLRDLDNNSLLRKTTVNDLGFAPSLLDGRNEPTPNETINLVAQREIEAMRDEFASYGVEVHSREQAINAVGQAHSLRAPYARRAR